MLECLKIIATLTLAFFTVLCAGGCSPQRTTEVKTEFIRLGTTLATNAFLAHIAEHNQYFSKNNLVVSYVSYQAGLLAAEGLLAGEVDLAQMSDFVVASKVAQNSDLRIVASISRSTEIRIVCPKSSGIRHLADLKGKKIGVMFGTSAMFYLNMILVSERILPSDLTLVDLNPQEQLRALTQRTVDAVIVWEPHATNAMKMLGEAAFSLPGQADLNMYWVLVGTGETLKKKSPAVERFLLAIIEAERFVARNTQESLEIVSKQLGMNVEDLVTTLKSHVIEVSLDRPLLKTLELQERWLNSLGMQKNQVFTDFTRIIDATSLHKVNPLLVREVMP